MLSLTGGNVKKIGPVHMWSGVFTHIRREAALAHPESQKAEFLKKKVIQSSKLAYMKELI